ncbi:tonsoku-like protein, partial [Clonorchis sinensis]
MYKNTNGGAKSCKAEEYFKVIQGGYKRAPSPTWWKKLWLGQPGSIPALVLPSGGMAARHRKGATAERFCQYLCTATSQIWLGQPGGIPILVRPSGGMVVRRRKGATAERVSDWGWWIAEEVRSMRIKLRLIMVDDALTTSSLCDSIFRSKTSHLNSRSPQKPPRGCRHTYLKLTINFVTHSCKTAIRGTVTKNSSRDHESALEEYFNLLKIWQSKEDKTQCALANRFIADCCIELGDFDKAVKHTHDYLTLAVETNNKLEQQRAFVTLGRCFLNRAESQKDGSIIMKSLKSASQALLSSIKLIGDLATTLTPTQLGEMRAVSLLNLGQVCRAQLDYASASERFNQCISLARKYQLPKVLFRACYQLSDLAMNTPHQAISKPLSRSALFQQCRTPSLRSALETVISALRSTLSKSSADSEAKDLLKNLKESYACLHLTMGEFRKTAKVYRLLKLDSPCSSDVCRDLIRKCMLMSNQFQLLPETLPTSFEGHSLVARTHERIGDLYSGIELYGPALRHYQLMLVHAQVASQLPGVSVSATATDKTNKLVDAALVSVAETYRNLGSYEHCVRTYQQEIQWVTTTGLSTAELATSWFSLAQAQRLCFNPSSESNAVIIPGSETTLETLQSALTASKSIGSIKLTVEILTEMEDYLSCNGQQSNELTRIRQELSRLRRDAKVDTQEDQENTIRETEGEDLADVTVDDDTVTKYIDLLSSDSEVEACIGHSELLDEFNAGNGGPRKGKALCLKTNMKGETPLHVAAINGDMEHVIKLIEVLGHPVNVTDGAGWLPIHEAAFHDRTEAAIYLLDRGARLDDPGCLEDLSTPLFEAIHNGSLATAIVLVQRGANLWHRNKRGECLPELLDTWEPSRRCTGTFNEQRERFDKLLAAVQERLGLDYDRWCNQPRSSPPMVTASSASTDSSPETVHMLSSPKRRSTPKQSRYTKSGSPSLSDISPPLRTRKPKSLRVQAWDELLVDLDDDTVQTSRRKQPHSGAKTGPVETYKQAMQAVAGSASRANKRKSAPGHSKSTTSQARRLTAAIDMDDTDWLVQDEQLPSKKQRLNSSVRKQFETVGLREGRKPADWDKSVIRLRDISHLQNTSLDFSPHGSAFTSTQLPSVSMSNEVQQKEIKQKLVSTPKGLPQKTTPVATTVASVVSSSVVVASATPVSSCDPAVKVPVDSQPISSASVSNKAFSVKVAFADISVLVPVDDSSRSVAWLANEAYRRRQILTSSRSGVVNSIQDSAYRVRLSTRDGALLLNTDRLHSVLPEFGRTGCVFELLAEIMDEACLDAPPLTQARQNSSPCNVAHIIEQKRDTASPLTGVEPVDLIVRSRFFRSLVERVQATRVVDLRYLSLGDNDCHLILDQLFSHGARSVTEVRLQGNSLKLDVMGVSPPDAIHRAPLILPLVRLASHLTSLDLDSNAISLNNFVRFLQELKRSSCTDLNSPGVVLPRLQRLSLAHNPFIGTVEGSVTASESSPHELSWIHLVGRLLQAFPKLTYLSLSGCLLGSLQQLLPLLAPIDLGTTVSALSEIDLSWNPHLSSDDLSLLVSSTALAGLRTLNLRGCSQSSAPAQYATSLPLSSNQAEEARWWFVPSKLTTSYASSFKFPPEPSHGDRLLDTLSKLLTE